MYCKRNDGFRKLSPKEERSMFFAIKGANAKLNAPFFCQHKTGAACVTGLKKVDREPSQTCFLSTENVSLSSLKGRKIYQLNQSWTLGPLTMSWTESLSGCHNGEGTSALGNRVTRQIQPFQSALYLAILAKGCKHRAKYQFFSGAQQTDN